MRHRFCTLLPPASEGWGKVLFSICQFTPRWGSIPYQVQAGGYHISGPGDGYPIPDPGPGWGVPHPADGGGNPDTPHQDRIGYPSPLPIRSS